MIDFSYAVEFSLIWTTRSESIVKIYRHCDPGKLSPLCLSIP